MTSRAGAVSSARVIEMNAEVQRHIEQRLFLAMVFIRQLAVFEGHRLAFRKEGDLNRVFTGSIRCCCSGALCFFFRHRIPYSKSAFATGWPACGPSSRSVSSIDFPLRAVETAVSII